MESTLSLVGNCESCGATPQFHLQNPFGVRKVTNPDMTTEFYGWNNVPVGQFTEECSHFMTFDGKKYDQERLFSLVISM